MKIYDIEEKRYQGIANPSGAVAVNDTLFIVGDDEDNLLRIYHRNAGDKPVQTIALSSVFKGIVADGEDLEIDVESAAALGNTVFWIGSHSTSKKGEFRPARHRLFGVHIKPGAKDKFTLSPAGDIYSTLIDDLQDDSRFDKFHFGKAKKTQAKAIGGLSIEGLAATPDNGLLIGFRNPLSGGEVKKGRLEKGNALMAKLKNPFEVIHGLKAKFADPIELDLGGFGIREITHYKKHKYLIIAGPYHENIPDEDHGLEEGKLIVWSSKSGKLNTLKKFDLSGFNFEGALFYPGNHDSVQLLSDDGKMTAAQGFRSLTLSL